MPVESFLPMIALRYVIGFSTDRSIDPNNLDFGFDPAVLLKNTAISSTPKKQQLLKEINSKFSEPDEGEDPRFIQVIVDENLVNSFILDFVLIERAFSIRSFLRLDKKFAEAMRQMTTDNLAMIMPEIGEEFGPGKGFDLYFSLSHSLIEKKIKDPKPSGFQIDRNGNFRFIFNFSVTILIEKKGAAGQWDEARSMFVSLVAKGKLMKSEKVDGKQTLTVLPKVLEIADIKIFNAADEPMVVEEMMIKSGFNVQAETALKMIPSYPFSL